MAHSYSLSSRRYGWLLACLLAKPWQVAQAQNKPAAPRALAPAPQVVPLSEVVGAQLCAQVMGSLYGEALHQPGPAGAARPQPGGPAPAECARLASLYSLRTTTGAATRSEHVEVTH